VWYRARRGDALNGHEHEAPHLLEEIYNFEDALLVGGIINTLMRNADRIKIACLAQLVNVIAPLVTNASGLLRQTIYYPYSWALQFARGSVLNVLLESPTYEASGLGQVPYLDVAATLDSQSNKPSMFLLNRDLDKARTVENQLAGLVPNQVLASTVLTGGRFKSPQHFRSPAASRSAAGGQACNDRGTHETRIAPKLIYMFVSGQQGFLHGAGDILDPGTLHK
jgi:alpha-N-arabinofuranosidase